MANNHIDDQFVVNHDGKWAVRGGGNSKVTKIFDTQADAKVYATQIAKKKKSDIYIQNKRGQFHQANSYGKDKCPPKDKNY